MQIRTNEELVQVLQKAQILAAGGGIATAEDAAEFVNLMQDQTDFLGQIRVENDIENGLNLHSWELDGNVTVPDDEGVTPPADDIIDVPRRKNLLQPVPVKSMFDIGFTFLRTNILSRARNQTGAPGDDRGGDSDEAIVEQALNDLFAQRMGKDITEMAWFADTAVVVPAPADPTYRNLKMLSAFDGLFKKFGADPDIITIATPGDLGQPGGTTYREHFRAMLALLPEDYKQDRRDLRFFLSYNNKDNYEDEIAERGTALGDRVVTGVEDLTWRSIPLFPPYKFGDVNIVLTHRRNIAVGFGRTISFGVDIDNRAGLIKVTIRAQVDSHFVVPGAVVHSS